MKLVQACMCETRRDFRIVQKDVMKLDKHQEGVEHQISTLEENYACLDKRLVALEKYMDTVAVHLNNSIERINTLHMYLKEKDEEESLKCHEVLLSSDDEFDFDEYEPNDGKIKEQ